MPALAHKHLDLARRAAAKAPLCMDSFVPVDARPDRLTIAPDLHEIANRVHKEFDDHVDPNAVDECLNQVAARFEGATVRSFIPLLVRRYVREELQTRLRQA
jgi:hypothetical protein